METVVGLTDLQKEERWLRQECLNMAIRTINNYNTQITGIEPVSDVDVIKSAQNYYDFVTK